MKKISHYAALAAVAVIGSAALPAGSAFGQDQDRDRDRSESRDDSRRPGDPNVDDVGVKFHRISTKDVEREVPKDVLRTMDKYTKGNRDLVYQRQERPNEGTFYSVHYTTEDRKRMFVRVAEDGKLALGPEVSQAKQRNAANPDYGRDRDRDRAEADRDRDRDRDREQETADRRRRMQEQREEINGNDIPAEVRKTAEQASAGGGGYKFYRVTQGDSEAYVITYDVQGKPMEMAIAADGRMLSQPAAPGAAPGAVAANQPQERRVEVSGNDIPVEVRRSAERVTAGGGGYKFYKVTRTGGGTPESYVIEYDRQGQSMGTEIAADGKVLVEPKAMAAAQPQPAPQPREDEAQLAAARQQAEQAAQAAAAPFQIITPGQAPQEAQAVIQREAANAQDVLVQRFTKGGRTLYGVHYTTPQGQRNFMAVDQQGKVEIKPRESNWQKAGKGARFEAIGADRLPAEVRQVVDKNGGGEHLVLLRTAPNGEKAYLVQYTDPKGRRMETHINDNGKVTMEPRNAREQPFTILERQGKDED